MTVTVQAFPGDGVEVPFVEVVASGFPEGTATVTVRRTAEGRSFVVRGLVRTNAAGAVSVRDYEAPLGRTSSYRSEFFDSSGLSLGFDSPKTVSLAFVEGPWGTSAAWFHDPLDPATAVLVSLTGGAGHPIARFTPGDVVSGPRRSVGIAFPGTRGGVRGLTLDCVTESLEDGNRLDSLLGGYDSDALSIVCVRTHPRTRFPGTLFAFVSEPVKAARDYDSWALQWAMDGDEVAPPAPAVLVPLLTYQDFANYYSTYQAFADAYPSYITASRDYSVKGDS